MGIPIGSESKVIVLKVKSPNEMFINIIMKYIRYFNSIFEKSEKMEIFFEPVHDGFLLLYRDAKAFDYAHQMIDDWKAKYHQLDEPDRNFLFDKIFLEQKFPQNGVPLYIQPISIPMERVFPVIKKFYPQISPEITVQFINKSNTKTEIEPLTGKIKLKLNTYEALSDFAHYLYVLLNEIHNQKKNPMKILV